MPYDVVVSAAAGLLGVAIGGWLTAHNQREERLHDRVREQLQHFYSPLLGIRAEIVAKSETRVKVRGATGAAWASLVRRTRASGPESLKALETERFPDFEAVIEYDDKQLIGELLPLYRQMVSHFAANMWLAEPSTLEYFGMLVEFVEMWNRWLNKAVPAEAVELLGHSEDELHRFYEDLATQLRLLRERLKK